MIHHAFVRDHLEALILIPVRGTCIEDQGVISRPLHEMVKVVEALESSHMVRLGLQDLGQHQEVLLDPSLPICYLT